MNKPQIKRLLYSYAGSKLKLAPEYVKLFAPHKTYVCPFLGSGAEFAHKPKSKIEIVNDIDNNIYSVFYCLRNKVYFNQLVELLRNSNDCAKLYYECYDKSKFSHLDTLERAYCYLVCGQLGFCGIAPTASRSFAKYPVKKPKLATVETALFAWRDRMRNVEVNCGDWQQVVDRNDSTTTFAFCDPPYVAGTCRQGLYLHNGFDHSRFIKRMQQFKGFAFICGYANSLYDIQLTGWRRLTFDVSKSLGGHAPRREIAWLNYDDCGKKLPQSKILKHFNKLRG